MPFEDKRDALSRLRKTGPITIELGCGPKKRYEDSIAVDSIAYECVDVVGDALDVLRALPPESVDLVTSCHFLEHVPQLSEIVAETARVLKSGGQMEAIVPHFSHPYFYSDPTHVNAFGLYTFSYLATNPSFRRQVPSYVRNADLEVSRTDLIFKSSRPFYGRHAWKKLIGSIFNSSRYMQEFYEENLCYVFPCYEIRFLLRKVTR